MASFAYNPSDYERLTTLGQAIEKFDQSISQSVLDAEIWYEEMSCGLLGSIDEIAVISSKNMTWHQYLVLAYCTAISICTLMRFLSTVSTPWTMPLDPLDFMDGRIVPRSWYFPDALGGARPYEFAFERHCEARRVAAATDLDTYPAFIAELGEILKKHKLTSILGLVALSPDYLPTEPQTMIKCEKTFGRANVVFEVGAEALNEKDKRTSIWTFGKFARGGRESMLCFSGCLCRPPTSAT